MQSDRLNLEKIEESFPQLTERSGQLVLSGACEERCMKADLGSCGHALDSFEKPKLCQKEIIRYIDIVCGKYPDAYGLDYNEDLKR